MRSLTKYLFIGSLIFAVLSLIAGLWLRRMVSEEAMRGIREDLRVLRNSNVTTVEQWLVAQEKAAVLTAREQEVVTTSLRLVEQSRLGLSPERLARLPEQSALQLGIRQTMQNWDFEHYVLIADGKVIAAPSEAIVGQALDEGDAELLTKLSERPAVLARPRKSRMAPDETVGPVMWVASGIFDDGGQLQAALAFSIDPAKSFTRLLAAASFSKSGETYAFDRDGFLISKSRFDSELRKDGLLKENEPSILNLKLLERDANLESTGRFTKAVRRSIPPQNEAEAQARQKQIAASESEAGVPSISSDLKEAERAAQRRLSLSWSDVDVDGYIDYRGVEVVGAWTWLDDYEFGIVTERNKADAHASLNVIRQATRGLVGGLLFTALLVVGASQLINRLERQASRAEQLGQYALVKKIGEGGMGSVYLARHALLRRPTAVKVMRADHIDAQSQERFQREVQATADLSHPNTVAIYDYGHTSTGVFYYAMEYLEGITLEGLVRAEGPQPQGRVVDVLLQCLGSLSEAHQRGLVHRDIKPANIMLTHRGGVPDLVKVLDFGLVKKIDKTQAASLTIANTITGTPHYMAPEAIMDGNTVDHRVDLYALGAVAYYLLTGRTVFEGSNIMAILSQHMTEQPTPPSKFTAAPLVGGLETIILRALAKRPEDRYQHASEMISDLEALRAASSLGWTRGESETWWSEHYPVLRSKPQAINSDPTLSVDLAAPSRAYRASKNSGGGQTLTVDQPQSGQRPKRPA